jgi:hypothetical protein
MTNVNDNQVNERGHEGGSRARGHNDNDNDQSLITDDADADGRMTADGMTEARGRLHAGALTLSPDGRGRCTRPPEAG